MIRTPYCANYRCNNRVPEEAWVWNPSTTHTCSKECAHALAVESRSTPVPGGNRTRLCERPGCFRVPKKEGQRFCSSECAARVQFGEKPGAEIAPSARSLKEALPWGPDLDALRTVEVRALYWEEISR